LFWQALVARQEAQIARINKNDLLYSKVIVRQPFEQCSKCPVAVVQPQVSGITIQRPKPGGCILRPVPICDVDCLHLTLTGNQNERYHSSNSVIGKSKDLWPGKILRRQASLLTKVNGVLFRRLCDGILR
jgi:hypothetical protein